MPTSTDAHADASAEQSSSHCPYPTPSRCPAPCHTRTYTTHSINPPESKARGCHRTSPAGAKCEPTRVRSRCVHVYIVPVQSARARQTPNRCPASPRIPADNRLRLRLRPTSKVSIPRPKAVQYIHLTCHWSEKPHGQDVRCRPCAARSGEIVGRGTEPNRASMRSDK
jgi:hypothetical protein